MSDEGPGYAAPSAPALVTVPGEPVAWKRAGSNGTRRYKQADVAAQQTAIVLMFRSSRARPIDGAVRVDLCFHVVGSAIADPDVDNFAKLVLDALNRVAYPDDRYVVELRAKIIGDSDDPRTEIVVQPAGEL